jgi:SnoaL-like domain
MRENVEFLRRGYEALQEGDLETFKALARERLGPEFEFHLVWDGRVLKGYEGTLEWLEDTGETWKDYSQELQEIIDLGQQVVVVPRRRYNPGRGADRSPAVQGVLHRQSRRGEDGDRRGRQRTWAGVEDAQRPGRVGR